MVEKIGYRRAIEALNMPVSRFAFTRVLPALVGSIIVAGLLVLLLSGIFSGIFALVPLVLPVFIVGAVLLYPLQVAQSMRQDMDHNMHYFITHLGVLSTSEVPRVELFDLIGEKTEEYGPLAEEAKKVSTLVKRWNMSLSEACRFIAHRTPSLIFSDFLERFAFGVESGAEMEAFLQSEQEVVMSDYETIYRNSLDRLDHLDGLYNGLMMTVIFLVLFGLLMPVLVGGSSTLILLLVFLLTLVIQGGFLILIKSQVPPDPVWRDIALRTPLWDRVKLVAPVSIVLALALAPVLLLATNLPHPVSIALAATPLVVPGFIATREEAGVKRRDDNYPAFMRSLGASTAARGGDAREVLRHLRHHDFGPLTEDIQNLFKRLQLRIDDPAAWNHFTRETGSMLVERFTRMYEEAIDTGGRPDAVGRIISDNMVQIIGLRKLRYQKASGFRGTLLGTAAAMAFSLFIGVGVLQMLTGLFSKIGDIDAGAVSIPTIIHTSGINVPMLVVIVLVLLVANAAISAIMIRFVDGGTQVRAFEDFSLFTWVSMVTALVSAKLLESMLGASIV